ncbi:MAG: VCBS repeat-containing protein, partial [Bacteroidales bacterium]|nr:VCBS repeat-containing protein [Bacteroidales bacterium]
MKKILIFLLGLIVSLPLDAQKKDILSDTLSSIPVSMPEKEAVYVSDSKNDNVRMTHSVTNKIIGKNTDEEYISKKLLEKEQLPVNNTYTLTLEEQQIIDKKKLDLDKYISSQSLSKESVTLSKESITLSDDQQAVIQSSTSGTGNTRQNPIVAGSFSTTFTYTNTQNTNDFTHDYTRPSGEIYKTNDVFYKFTLTKAMTVNIRHCGSQLSDTYLYLLNSSGGYIDKNDDYSGGCSSIRHAYYTISLSAGTYYVVSEGYSQNGYITTTIEGTMITGDVLGVPIVAGSFSTNFSYSNSQNTNNFTHKYTRTQFDPATKDVFYKFTITNYMSVIMKHCGSSLDDTYLYLLDASGNLILPRDDYSDKEGYCSSNILHSYLKQNLAPGTYYVVSEGYNKNGVIKTQISGTVLPTGDTQINPVYAGTFSDNFQYSNTQNTANFHDEYHYPPKSNKTNDVFHRFTLSKKMTVTMTHCGSALGDTYMCLLDEKGDLILPNDDYWTTGDDRCSNSYHSVIKRELDAGTYYIVSEGYSQNGSITLNIKGFLNEFNYPQSYDANINISGGSATATIPIEIPAGVNGVQPNVGLIYNNRAGFGLAGYGWTVSGLSTITVTGKNLYHDNEITSPTSGGPYVLDGQRMIADGSNYTLENNRSVSIRPSGTNYIVYYPDGSKATYSAYISKYIWRITKFETYTGNYVTYTYSGINIDKIEYGGNSGKGSSHFVSVKFTYESNPDINVSFIGKNILKYDQRIKVIEICVNSSVFRTYKLNYNNGYYKQLSRVDIKANYETMQPVTISYGYNTNAAYNLKETTLSGHYYRATNHRDAYIYSGKICDWENSNQIVVLQRKDNYNSDDKIYVYEGIDAFTTSNVGTSISMNVGANFKQLFVANVDGTPEDEIVKISQTGVQFTVDVYTLSLSTGIVKKVTRSSSGVNAQTRFLLGDFKGKGRNILLHVQPGSSYIYLRDLTEASAIGVSIKGFDYKDGDILLSMDYDGDGKTDFAHVNSAGLKIYTVSATGTSWTQIASSTYFNRDKLATISEGRGNVTVVSTSMLLVGDINGDGRSDFLITPHSSRESNGEYLLQPKYNRQWVIFFSDGTGGLIGGTFADDRYNSLGHVNIDGGTFLHDMNGDGKSDLVTMYKPNEAYIYYSIGDGFLNSNYKMIPLTGDGLITTINRWSSNNNNFLAHVRNSKIQCVNFLRDEQKEAFLTKMGNTQVNYDRIDLSGKNGKYFYNHGSGATLPYRNLKYEPLYVVTNYKTSSGNIVISNYDYTYTNAVAHLHGLGFCGFEKIEIYDKLRGQTVTETYEPYRFGLPQKTESPTQISENTWSVTTTSTYPKSSKITLTKQKVTDKLTGNVVEATLQYNSYGMPTKTTITKGSMTETVSNTYE